MAVVAANDPLCKSDSPSLLDEAWQPVPLAWADRAEALGRWPSLVAYMLQRVNGRLWSWRFDGNVIQIWHALSRRFRGWIGRDNFILAWRSLTEAGLVRCEGDGWRCVVDSAHHAPEAPGLVYFVQAGDDGPVKIGFSRAPAQRVADLQTSNPAPLRLLATIPGCLVSEAMLHREFGEHRIRGEWFHPARVVAWLRDAGALT